MTIHVHNLNPCSNSLAVLCSTHSYKRHSGCNERMLSHGSTVWVGGIRNNSWCQERIIEIKGRGREREMTTHLIKIPVLTHASCITKLRLFLRRRQRSLEFRLVQPDDKALEAFPWIWDRVEAYRRSKEQTRSFLWSLEIVCKLF